MAGEREQLAVGTVRAAFYGPEIRDAARRNGFALEANRGQALDQQVLAVLIVGRDGRARDELFREKKGAGHGFEPLSIKMPARRPAGIKIRAPFHQGRAMLRVKA